MTHALLKEDGFYLLKEDGGKLLLEGAEGPFTQTIDFLFDLAGSLGVRDKPELNYEFKRNISLNMK